MLDENGYRVRTYDEILEEINTDIQNGIPNLSLDDSNPLIKINKKMADMFNQASQLGMHIYKSFTVDEASGSALEDRVFWLGITRYKAKKSSGEIEISGTSGTIIPSGWRVSTSDDVEYYTLNTVTIQPNGKVKVFIESLDEGYFTRCSIGAINKIVNPTLGVDSVTNLTAIVGGTDTETDVQLRERYYNTLRGLGKSTIPSIKNAIILHTTATKVSLVENDTDTEDLKTGLPPHSFALYVNGGENEDIFNQIYESRPIGITSIGDIEKQIEGYWVRFSRPVNKELHVSITLGLNPNTDTKNIAQIIKSNLIELIDSLDIGAKIDYSMIISSLYKNTENAVQSFDDLEFYIDMGDKKGLGDFIQLDKNQMATLLEKDITIGGI